jgi:hypothetical protein
MEVRMDKFTVEKRGPGEECFIAVAGSPMRIELDEPADFQHAWRVATFLNENVRDIERGSDPE